MQQWLVPIRIEHERVPLDLEPTTLLAGWPRDVDRLGDVLGRYEDALSSCQSSEEVLFKTYSFVRGMFLSSSPGKDECVCIRSAQNGRELKYKCVDCNRAEEEDRAYGLEKPTIITLAARKGVAILEDDQGNHGENGRKDEDRGPMMSVALPYRKGLWSPRLQITCCDLGCDEDGHALRAGRFNIYHVTTVHYILMRMTEVYRGQKFRELLAGQLDEESIETVLEEKVSPAKSSLAFYIPAANKTKFVHPVYLTSAREEGALPNKILGYRPCQEIALEALQDEQPLGIFYRRGNDLVVGNKVVALSVPDEWPEGLCVAIVPLTSEGTMHGWLWLERYGSLFEISEFDSFLKDAKDVVRDLAAVSVARALRFLAVGSEGAAPQ